MIRWNDRQTPVSPLFDDIYFAVEDGLRETRYVFLENNQLPQAWSERPIFHIAELGFGTGLNFLAAAELFLKTAKANQKLFFSSFEKFPLTRAEIEISLGRWPELDPLAKEFLSQYEPLPLGCHRFELFDRRVYLDLWIGDARDSLKEFEGPVDAWFFDGFAPHKNAEFWSEEIFAEVRRASSSGCRFATYASTGFVQRALKKFGFKIEKCRGFGKKREMLRGYLPGHPTTRPPVPETIQIQGAGIVGCLQAYTGSAFASRVLLSEKESTPCSKASGNPRALVMPTLTAKQSPLGAWSLSSFLQTLRLFRSFGDDESIGWHPTGLLQLWSLNPDDLRRQERYFESLQSYQIPPSIARTVSREEASELAGIRLKQSGIYFPQAGSLEPHRFAQRLLEKAAISWQSPPAPHTPQILCTGADSWMWMKENFPEVPVRLHRGQVSYWTRSSSLKNLKCPVVSGSYALPISADQLLAGSTYEENDWSQDLREVDHAKILNDVSSFLGPQENIEVLGGRAAHRLSLRDALPLLSDSPHQWANLAYGSKAFSHAILGCHYLLSSLFHLPKPGPLSLWRSSHIQRFAKAESRMLG